MLEPVMKFLGLVKKELDLIRSQKLAVVLIFFYPFLAIYLLGLSAPEIDNIELTVSAFVPESKDFNAQDFFSELSNNGRLKIIPENSRDAVVLSLKNKKSLIGLAVRESSNPSAPTEIDLFIDNSNILTSKLFLGVAQTIVRNVGATRTSTILSSFWKDLNEFSGKIDIELGRITQFETELDYSFKALSDINREIGKINIAFLNQKIEDQKNIVRQLSGDITEYSASLAEVKARSTSLKGISTKFSAARQDLNEMLLAYEQIGPDINRSIELIDAYEAALQGSKQQLVDINRELGLALVAFSSFDAYIPEGEKGEFASLSEEFSQLNSGMSNEIEGMDASLLDINRTKYWLKYYQSKSTGVKTKLENARNGLEEAESELNSFSRLIDEKVVFAESQLSDLNNTLSISLMKLEEFQKELEVISNTSEMIKSFLNNSMENNKRLKQRIANGRELFIIIKEKLDFLDRYNPDTLSNPVRIYESPLFAVQNLVVLLPNVFALVLLFSCMLLTSISIISEKAQGVEVRMRLSTTPKITFISAKIIGQILVALLEAAIILAVATFLIFSSESQISNSENLQVPGFFLPIAGSLSDLAIATALVSLAFISIGLLITNFTKTHSTTILASLLIMLPMIFLSGMIIPLEFTSPFIREFASILPLTLANEIFKAIIVRGASLAVLAPELFMLLLPAIAIIAYTAINENKE